VWSPWTGRLTGSSQCRQPKNAGSRHFTNSGSWKGTQDWSRFAERGTITMARRRKPSGSFHSRWQLADRLRTIRTELFGVNSLAEFARLIDVPIRTWYSYETGVTVPAEVLLRFVELTLVEPRWLLHGQEPRYRVATANPDDEEAETSAKTRAQLRPGRIEPNRPP